MKIRACAVRALVFLALIALRPEVQACGVCFGKSDSSNMAKGMNMGIFVLLLCIGIVLATLSTFFVFLAVRSSRLPQPPTGTAVTLSPEPPANS
jgi:hypothetical protein